MDYYLIGSRYSLYSVFSMENSQFTDSCYLRREALWPELDKLLRDEDDSTTVSTPYTAAVLEYRVVFYDAADVSGGDKRWAFANGHAVYDAQHPCRCLRSEYFGFDFVTISSSPHFTYGITVCRANVAVRKELHTPASDRSCTHLEFDISGTRLT